MADQHSVAELIRGKGYHLLPKSHPGSPGYSGLLIALREHPAAKDFAPVEIRIRLRESCEGLSCWTMLKASTPLDGAARVCPGEVTAFDLADNRKHFFTFGASVESVAIEHGIVYVLSSPAPILEKDIPGELVATELAVETEAMMAKAKAKWKLDEAGFASKLDEVAPFQFYAAALQELLLVYRSGDCPATGTHRSLCDALHQECSWLKDKGKWPKTALTFENLLAPPRGSR